MLQVGPGGLKQMEAIHEDSKAGDFEEQSTHCRPRADCMYHYCSVHQQSELLPGWKRRKEEEGEAKAPEWQDVRITSAAYSMH